MNKSYRSILTLLMLVYGLLAMGQRVPKNALVQCKYGDSIQIFLKKKEVITLKVRNADGTFILLSGALKSYQDSIFTIMNGKKDFRIHAKNIETISGGDIDAETKVKKGNKKKRTIFIILGLLNLLGVTLILKDPGCGAIFFGIILGVIDLAGLFALISIGSTKKNSNLPFEIFINSKTCSCKQLVYKIT